MNNPLTKKARLLYSSDSCCSSDFKNKENHSRDTEVSLKNCTGAKLNWSKLNDSQLIPQKKNLDVGDLHISILNENKNKELLHFGYISKSKRGNVLSTISNNQKDSLKGEKEYRGTVKIKIFEDKLGKRRYECALDFPEKSQMKMDESKNEVSFSIANSQCFLKLNSQKTDKQSLKNCSNKFLLKNHQNKNLNKLAESKF